MPADRTLDAAAQRCAVAIDLEPKTAHEANNSAQPGVEALASTLVSFGAAKDHGIVAVSRIAQDDPRSSWG